MVKVENCHGFKRCPLQRPKAQSAGVSFRVSPIEMNGIWAEEDFDTLVMTPFILVRLEEEEFLTVDASVILQD